jgi:hypothetical protein
MTPPPPSTEELCPTMWDPMLLDPIPSMPWLLTSCPKLAPELSRSSNNARTFSERNNVPPKELTLWRFAPIGPWMILRKKIDSKPNSKLLIYYNINVLWKSVSITREEVWKRFQPKLGLMEPGNFFLF